jgi:hypothetical protein
MNTDAEEEPARKGDGAEEPHHPAHRCTDTGLLPSFNARTFSPSLESVAFNTALKKLQEKKRFGCVSHGFPTHLHRFLRARFLKD